MSEPKDRTTRRLYSLYPDQVQKLAELSRLAGISRSEYLRQLIDVAYVEKIQQPKFARYYGRKVTDEAN